MKHFINNKSKEYLKGFANALANARYYNEEELHETINLILDKLEDARS